MRYVLAALLAHGYALLFGSVLCEQLGAPLPAVPVLLAAGALCATGNLSMPFALLIGIVACLAGDLPWYWLGRVRGTAVLRLLCRISLEPDSCVRRTEEVFVQRGPLALLYAKFVPGLSTVAPPLSGITHMAFGRFLVFDGLGSAAWLGAYLVVGYIFGGQLEQLAAIIAGTGRWLVVIVSAPLAGWILWKYWQRRTFIRKLRVARIDPAEVLTLIEGGERPFVVDLRNQVNEGDAMLPGAIHLSPGELDVRALEIPFDRDIILYCS